VSAFCREHGLCEQPFYYWRKRVRPDSILPAVKAGFAEAAVELTQFPVYLPKKPNLLGGCCGSDHPADRAVDPFAAKIVRTYPRINYYT
jgi:hypothetical protein